MLFALAAAFFGLVAGSFINAYVWRTHSGQSLVRDRSRCTACESHLRPRDLIPVVSWVALRGKCRGCDAKISLQYPLVEIFTAVFFVLSLGLLGLPSSVIEWLLLLVWLAIVGQFIALAVYDLRWQILPDKMTAVLLSLVVTYQLLHALGGAPLWEWLISPMLGGLGALAVFYSLYAAGKGKWMGGGDVKLVFVLGLLLGGSMTVLGLMLAFNIAAIVSISLILLRLRTRKDSVPFGPFLLFGAWLAMMYGAGIIDWYLRVSGF